MSQLVLGIYPLLSIPRGASGSDAILLESNGHYALIDMGEDYDFPDGTNPRYPSRVGITRQNDLVLEDRLFRQSKSTRD